MPRPLPVVFASIILLSCVAAANAQTLRDQLAYEPRAKLAQAMMSEGDAARGAIVFFQPAMACHKCHTTDGSGSLIGPDLAKVGREATPEYLIESLLDPSKTIKRGFEAVTVQTSDGRTLVGLVVAESAAELTLREATAEAKRLTIPLADIDERVANKVSLMPADVVNQLAERRQFLDLVRYLVEIAAGGPQRARQLQPAASLLAVQLPEYERHVDHAGIIADWDKKSFKRGEAIYNSLCINCHGTQDRPGSLPTSLRFASGKFKNGSDPLRMYQTLTHGFGLMMPQTWMVPQQKYDVIHYIREEYLKDSNPSQYFAIAPSYLAGLPKGNTRGPKPKKYEPWATMNYGPYLAATYEIGSDGSNFAHKGIAVRLDSGPGGVAQGRHWMVFDHDTLRMAAGWSGKGFIDYQGINFDGRHNAHPHIVGDVAFANRTGPGWANPADGSFDDPRQLGRDGRRYGPLPKSWGQFRGYYQHGEKVIFSYTIGDTEVLEMPGVVMDGETPTFVRTFEIGARSRDLQLVVAPTGSSLNTNTIPSSLNAKWSLDSSSRLLLSLPAGKEPLKFDVTIVNRGGIGSFAASQPTATDLVSLAHGGPRRWPDVLTTTATLGADSGPFAVDVLTHPVVNPWSCQMRLTGFDFLPDGDCAAVCSWDGDVWLVSGLKGLTPEKHKHSAELAWRRIASGLFQPLGLKIVGEKIYVSCRDQIVLLRDLNGDGETDFYECFNNDHQVTEHFHEFAMGLQTDAAGNFYYAKSARHALPAVVPQHGTLLRVSADGQRTDILAAGFRAANGVCLNPDGSFVVTDQEGHWNPKNRINWVTAGKFYGNMFGYHDVTDTSDSAMEPPLCWITNACDRSPAELLWVPHGCWGPLAGSLLNLSYGYGKAFIVPHETVDGMRQGGMCELPLGTPGNALPTGIMRGRFHPLDHQLYTCGMYAWAGSATQPGGFYRLRYTGQPAYLPLELHAARDGMSLTFSDALDSKTAADASRYEVRVWNIKRTANYGSEHYDERVLPVTKALVSSNGRSVSLILPEFKPTWCMSIQYRLTGAHGEPVNGLIHNTVHALK